jgi:hypothetical protein
MQVMDGRMHPGANRSSVARAVLCTVLVVALGASAHHLGGGGLPPTGLLLALGLLVGVVSFLLRRQLLSVPVAAGTAVIGQVLLHCVFVAAEAHGAHDMAAQVTPAMVAAHGVATLLTVLALRWQEQLVARLVDLALPTTPVPAALDLERYPDAADWIRCRQRSLEIVRCVPRRGPPLHAAAS